MSLLGTSADSTKYNIGTVLPHAEEASRESTSMQILVQIIGHYCPNKLVVGNNVEDAVSEAEAALNNIVDKKTPVVARVDSEIALLKVLVYPEASDPSLLTEVLALFNNPGKSKGSAMGVLAASNIGKHLVRAASIKATELEEAEVKVKQVATTVAKVDDLPTALAPESVQAAKAIMEELASSSAASGGIPGNVASLTVVAEKANSWCERMEAVVCEKMLQICNEANADGGDDESTSWKFGDVDYCKHNFNLAQEFGKLYHTWCSQLYAKCCGGKNTNNDEPFMSFLTVLFNCFRAYSEEEVKDRKDLGRHPLPKLNSLGLSFLTSPKDSLPTINDEHLARFIDFMRSLCDTSPLDAILKWCLCVIWRTATAVGQEIATKVGGSVTTNLAFSLDSLLNCIDNEGNINMAEEMRVKLDACNLVDEAAKMDEARGALRVLMRSPKMNGVYGTSEEQMNALATSMPAFLAAFKAGVSQAAHAAAARTDSARGIKELKFVQEFHDCVKELRSVKVASKACKDKPHAEIHNVSIALSKVLDKFTTALRAMAAESAEEVNNLINILKEHSKDVKGLLAGLDDQAIITQFTNYEGDGRQQFMNALKSLTGQAPEGQAAGGLKRLDRIIAAMTGTDEKDGDIDLKQLCSDGVKARQAARLQVTLRTAVILIQNKDKTGIPKFHAEVKKLQVAVPKDIRVRLDALAAA